MYKLMEARLTWRAIIETFMLMHFIALFKSQNLLSKHLVRLDLSSRAISQQSTKCLKETQCKCKEKWGNSRPFTNLLFRCSVQMIDYQCPKSRQGLCLRPSMRCPSWPACLHSPRRRINRPAASTRGCNTIWIIRCRPLWHSIRSRRRSASKENS